MWGCGSKYWTFWYGGGAGCRGPGAVPGAVSEAASTIGGMVAALYRRYRPETFAELIGQQQVTEPLSQAIRSGRINHAYLFSGPRGCGKTSSARILARCLNCEQGPTPTPCGVCASCRELGREGGGSLDVMEIDAASHGGVEDARELRERAVMAPSRDRYRIFIIDEAHMVTSQGFNALLKVVEEPPEHVLFVFATTEPEKVIGTIRSRTHHYPFRLIPPAPMLEYVERICAQEGIDAEPGVLPLVVRAGGGSARDTLSLLDQLIAGTDGERMNYALAAGLLGFTAGELLDETITAFADASAAAAYRTVDAVIQSGQDPRRFVEDLLERVRDLVVVKAVGQSASAVLRGVPPEELERMHAAAARFTPAALSSIGDAVNATLTEMTGVTAPRLQLELMVARILVAMRADFAAEQDAGAVSVPMPARDARGIARAGAADREGVARRAPTTTEPTAGNRAAPAGEAPTQPQDVAGAQTARVAQEWVRETESASARQPLREQPQRAHTGSRVAEPSEEAASGERHVPAPTRNDVPEAMREAGPASGAAFVSAGAQEPAPGAAPASTGEPGPTRGAAPEPVREPEIGQIRDAWPSVVEAVQRHGGRAAWAIVQPLQPLEYAEGVLALWFPNRGVAEQLRAGTPPPVNALKQALREVFGVEMKIQPKYSRQSPRQPEPAQHAESASQGRPLDQSVRTPESAHRSASAPDRAAPEASATAEAEWNVAPIPNDPPDDGPGSGWDEYAQPSVEEVAAQDAATHELEPSAPAAPRADPVPAPAVPAVPAVPAASASASAPAAPAPAPAPAAPAPVPAPVPAPAPAASAARQHPAELAGGERYGESVLRERLGARFISEQPREV